MTKRDGKGRFQRGTSGNPKGRPPEAERIRQLLEPRREELIAKAVDLALSGDTTALRLCVDRLAPALKPEGRTVTIPALEAAVTLTERANAIMQAIAAGAVPVEVGERLLAALGHVAKVVEIDELAARVAALEQREEDE